MTDITISHRVRNRIIETLRQIIECRTGRLDTGLNELVNTWDDWIARPIDETNYPAPVYTPTEVQKIRAVEVAMEIFCRSTPQSIVNEDQARQIAEWAQLVDAAEGAYIEFMIRGKSCDA